jgi:hypothetical protein
MDRSNFTRNPPRSGTLPARLGRLPTQNPTLAAAPVRAPSEYAWANANRAWTIACRLAATRR